MRRQLRQIHKQCRLPCSFSERKRISVSTSGNGRNHVRNRKGVLSITPVGGSDQIEERFVLGDTIERAIERLPRTFNQTVSRCTGNDLNLANVRIREPAAVW
jgi:hypothetical protein